jgi:hypothetical protein
VAASKENAKKPAGLKTRPPWLRQDRLGANPAVCHDDVGCQAGRLLPYRLEVADGDDLILGPDLDGEGEGSAA